MVEEEAKKEMGAAVWKGRGAGAVALLPTPNWRAMRRRQLSSSFQATAVKRTYTRDILFDWLVCMVAGSRRSIVSWFV